MTETDGGARGTRLIRNESTTEIPVHLLFRDDPDPVAVPLRPAVVTKATGAATADAAEGKSAAKSRTAPAARRTPPAATATAAATAPARSAPSADPDIEERPVRALPGAFGVFGGAVGAAGAAASAGWAGALPKVVTDLAGVGGSVGAGFGPAQWAALAGSGALAAFGVGGLARGRTGGAWVLTRFGRYRGSVRRQGLLWLNPLLRRRRVDLRLRHWRSEPLPAVDANGEALRVVVLVAWRIKDTARATLGVADHETYLRECVETGLARVLSRLPAEVRDRDAPALRGVEILGDLLTRRLAEDAAAVGIEVFSAQPTRIEYEPEVAAAMRRRRIAALDARQRDTVLTSVVDSVEDTVTRLTARGLVDLDDYERKLLVKDLTVAFYTGRGE
ncbi:MULTISPECIES: SPFH domain-containing protein [unclassified Streptomyces]|uniref:SPFH domain-containing protein n=1 Tax=unclassified Streptomyces TaxID=2593676 RepID=UPI00278BD106|nr:MULTISPECIES: SPFH domain-containing protein [unclassified Streptomyces]